MIYYDASEDRTYIEDGDFRIRFEGTIDEHVWWVREKGRLHGYPSCCVEQFVLDLLAGRLPALRRRVTPAPSGDGVYVQCSACEVTEGLRMLHAG